MKKHTFLSIIKVLFFLTLLFTSFNINNPYLWFDEAGTFWISKGLNPEADPLQEINGVTDVIKINAQYSYEPGGFSVLLNIWSLISNSYLWLRGLPFIFYLGIIISFIYLSYFWTNDFRVSFLMGFLPLLHKNIVAMGFEIRPYGMEYLGVLVGIIALYSLLSKFSYKKLFLWSCVLSIFITSRYSIIVVYFTLSLLLIWQIIKDKLELKHILSTVFLWGTPLLFSLVVIYFLSLRIQNPGLEKLSYLPYLQDDWLLLFKPIHHLAYLFLLMSLSLFSLLIKKFKITPFQKYLPLFYISLLTNIIFIFFFISW